MRDIFSKKVNPDRWLHGINDTLADYSNRSWIYFSIMLDLPTDCPPKKTIFILVFPVTVLLIEWFIIQTFIISNPNTSILIAPPKTPTTLTAWSRRSSDLPLITYRFWTKKYMGEVCSRKSKEICRRFCGGCDLCLGSWNRLCRNLYFSDRNKLPPMAFWGHSAPLDQEKRRQFLPMGQLWIWNACWELYFSMDSHHPSRFHLGAGLVAIPTWEGWILPVLFRISFLLRPNSLIIFSYYFSGRFQSDAFRFSA